MAIHILQLHAHDQLLDWLALSQQEHIYAQ